jgi:hypothetical protein
MFGHIVRYDAASQRGLLASGRKTYHFGLDAWIYESPPYNGCHVEFEETPEGAKNIMLLGEYNPPCGEPVKSRIVAGLLGLALGWAGVHRFYLGYYKLGFFQVLATAITLGAGAVWGLADAVLILAGHIERDGQNRPLK